MSKRKAKYCAGAALAGWLNATGGAVIVQPRAGEAVEPLPNAAAA